MNSKTVTIVVSAVSLLTAGLGYITHQIDANQLAAAWAAFSPVILAAIGLQQAATAAEVKEMKSRMLEQPK